MTSLKEETKSLISPFEFVKSINSGRDAVLVGDSDSISEYNYFVINKAFSLHPDTILVANEMNMNSWLPPRMQYKFYLNMIRPKKRFSPWPKKVDDASLAVVQEYYKCSYRKALVALSILNSSQIKELKERMGKEDGEPKQKRIS